MAEEYPFPIPEARKRSVSLDLARVFPPWHGLDLLELRPTDPAIVRYVYHWYQVTVGLIKGIEKLVMDLDPVHYEPAYQGEEWRTLSAQVAAMDLRLKQLEALLEWASLTWKHDPEILRVFNKEPEEPATGEKTDTESGTVENSPAGNSPGEKGEKVISLDRQ